MSNVLQNPEIGSLLVAEPFLGDSNFDRTVILLTSHNDEGSVGFVLNKSLELSLNEIAVDFPKLDTDIYHGGPVQEDNLYFIHNKGSLIPGSIPITGDLFWGGDLEPLKELISTGLILPENIRFYLGYSGWGAGQLQHEIEEKSWLVLDFNQIDLFKDSHEDMWPKVLKAVGGTYPLWANSPADPNLN